MSDVPIAELHSAYVWDCDNCGAENFERSCVFEPSEEEAAELRNEHGIELYDTGEWCTCPEEVTCRECGKAYATRRDVAEQ